MNNTALIYMRGQIARAVDDIIRAQRDIAMARVYRTGYDRTVRQGSGRTVRGRSGALLRALESPSSRVWIPVSGGVEARTSLPLYIRFLDMKEHGNYMIYNRQIWGILYADTLANIKYEYRDWLREKFPELLDNFTTK